jgi:hypothetical protein
LYICDESREGVVLSAATGADMTGLILVRGDKGCDPARSHAPNRHPLRW